MLVSNLLNPCGNLTLSSMLLYTMIHSLRSKISIKTYALDSSQIISEIYESVNQTHDFIVEPAKRSETCSLENAINVNIDGKLFCLAHVGQMKHKDALHMCQSLNATLPLPQSLKEYNHFTESFKRLGIGGKMNDLSTKIVLDIRRLSNTGRVSLFRPQIYKSLVHKKLN